MVDLPGAVLFSALVAAFGLQFTILVEPLGWAIRMFRARKNFPNEKDELDHFALTFL
jgi:hypothetical protein